MKVHQEIDEVSLIQESVFADASGSIVEDTLELQKRAQHRLVLSDQLVEILPLPTDNLYSCVG